MNILNPGKFKCIVFDQLRHTWTFLLFICDFLAKIYRTPRITAHQEQLANHNNNNNNNNDLIMEQDMPEEEVGQPEEALPQQDNGEVVDRFNAIQAAVELMDAASDLDEEEEEEDDDVDVDVDYGDTDSESEFEEMYSDEWTSSSDELDEGTELSKSVLNVFLSSDKQQSQMAGQIPMYAFQPLRLVKCQYRDKHIPGGFPLARSGHRIIASNSHLYSLGGYNPRSAMSASRHGRCLLFQELWSYNFATRTWRLELNAGNAANMPVELASNALTIHNNVLIVSIYLMVIAADGGRGSWGFRQTKIDELDCLLLVGCVGKHKEKPTRLKIVIFKEKQKRSVVVDFFVLFRSNC